MRRRDFAFGALAAAGVLGSAGCNRSGKKQIGVVPKGSAHLFWQSVHAGAVKHAQEVGVDIIWNGPAAETDFNQQIQIVDAMINRRVDAIALAPIDKKSMVKVVDRAHEAKIPVVIFDSGIDTDNYVSLVATDNYKAGEMGANRVAEILDGNGKIAMVMVQPGAASTMAREQGFKDRIGKVYPEIQIVDERYGWADFSKSMAVTENILTAHPEVQVLFGSNESSTVGATQALKGRKSTVKLVGFDSSPQLVADLRAGIIDSLVIQDPFRMGYESVKAAMDHLSGKTVAKVQNIPPKLVTKANVDTPEIQQQLNPDLKKYLG
ncbi:LacI family transcriptional regulator [Bryobacterales bacterium F-183]|nr:LacI family transcriptional regulator [Bryobacterales bacterium F-183]